MSRVVIAHCILDVMSGTIRLIHHSDVMQQPSVNQRNSCSWNYEIRDNNGRRRSGLELRHWWCRLEHRMWSTTTVWFACRVRRGHWGAASCRNVELSEFRTCHSSKNHQTTLATFRRYGSKKGQMLQILKQSQRAWRTTLPKTGGKRERFDAQISEWNLAAGVDAERDLLWGSHHPHSACGKMTIWQFKVGCNFNFHEYWRPKAYPIQR